MTENPASTRTADGEVPTDGRTVVFRGGTVVTVDAARRVLADTDVLVIGQNIAAIGTALEVPEGTFEIDASGGIVMPGMVDTHRHMWQTAMRGYGADWTLTQYFVWYYLEHGKSFRPEDVRAGNRLSALDAIDAGVTTTVDWSHGLRTLDHAEAAIDALRSSAGRYVLAYGNIFAGPWEWTADAAVRRFLSENNTGSERLRVQLAFDVTGDPEFPERAAFEAARELGLPVTTHAGVWGATNDDGIRLMHENGFMTPETVYVHAATLSDDSYHRIAATGGSVSLSTESELSCGQGYPPSWILRQHGIPVSLSVDTSVWFSSDLFSAMRSTLGADRGWEHTRAHEKGETVTHSHLRAEHVVDWATRGGAESLGLGDVIGSLEPGKRADIVLIKNDASPTMFPIVNPNGHIALQAGRGDVHSVMVDGALAKYAGRLLGDTLDSVRNDIEATVDYLHSELGDPTWEQGMNPDAPEEKMLDNPYTYTDYKDASTHTADRQTAGSV
ncbi:amidohydrolase family protein [Herbiconiux daphne]|uniref:Amidohydrolase family protein n=1 Tax=Herbiconiux daphne TaxID=2970914 RepID=A0ABT2H2I6_9MICO|nr:amidohydrolase family protein [Herbiconiux daphne]MCS5734096.1 amidohydrolase family protein [Herbiconiux daphne]